MAKNPATFVRLPQPLKAALEKAAKQDQRTLSAFLRMLILEAWNRRTSIPGKGK